MNIQQSCGALKFVAYIPHGVGSAFKEVTPERSWPDSDERTIKCVYVSNAEIYKHQWVVVKAVSTLRKRDHNINLRLVGGGKRHAQRKFEKVVASQDPDGEFVEQLEFLLHAVLPELLAQTDLFVFASSCENMPVTLVDVMAVGLHIECSNRRLMHEILADGGVYFDPEDSGFFAAAIEQLMHSSALRLSCCRRTKSLAQRYSWKRCADETLKFIK
jgi:glycosyltransferase involved in cell wall biosynthesis